ncbi:hypothetical protein X975_16529, partial [Stegodyphus mimosarum]
MCSSFHLEEYHQDYLQFLDLMRSSHILLKFQMLGTEHNNVIQNT